MIEVITLIGIGAGAALGGVFVGHRIVNAAPYKPANKRTEHDVKRDEKILEKHFSVINIEDEADEIVKDMDQPQERPFGEPIANQLDVYEFEASVCESPVKTEKRFYVCEHPQCSFRAKNVPASDGKHYCKNHAPVEE